jgi:hypothetical protein
MRNRFVMALRAKRLKRPGIRQARQADMSGKPSWFYHENTISQAPTVA